MDKEIVYKSMEYIDEHFKERITVGELAKQFAYSKSVLGSEFKKVSGMTMLDYINKKRFEWARKNLLEGKSCSYISDVLGYNSLNAFRYSYEKYFGINPIKDRTGFKAGNRVYNYHYHKPVNAGRRKKVV